MRNAAPHHTLVNERAVWIDDETVIAEMQARYSEQVIIGHIQSVIRQADINGCTRAVVLLVGNESDIHSVYTADFHNRKADNSPCLFRCVSHSQQAIEALAAALSIKNEKDMTNITVLQKL